MAFLPGRAKTGGRKKGTPNRITAEVAELLADKGFNPVLKAIEVFDNPERPGAQLQARIALELLEYIKAKRLRVQVVGAPDADPDGPVRVQYLNKPYADNPVTVSPSEASRSDQPTPAL